MQINCTVLQESSRQGNDGREFNSILCLETGKNAMAQIFEYGLRGTEAALKGTLAGKSVIIDCTGDGQIMGLFNGRVRITGKLITTKG